MNIIVEDGFSTIHKTGVGQYTDTINNLLQNLDCKILTIEKIFLCKIRNKFLRRFLYNIWLNSIFLLKLFILNKKITVIFTNYAIPIFKLKNVQYISVIHDLCMFKFAQHENFIVNTFEKNNVKNAVKNSDKIITVSNTIKNELIEFFQINSKKIFVVHNALARSFINNNSNSNALEKYDIKTKKYILSVATLNKRKNIYELIKAYEGIADKYPDLKLVLVGGMGNENRKILTKHPNVIFTGYIPDEDIHSLYENALLYVFPSLYEGFGTPILEAQYSRCPILCSDIPVFREIAGEGALFCDISINDFAKNLKNLISDENLQNQLVLKGSINIKKYREEKIIDDLINILKEL